VSELELPDLVAQRALHNGNAGRAWLDELPRVVAQLSERWGLVLGSPFAGGTAGCVVAATDSRGRACVLKVAMPLDMDERDSFVRAVRAHRLAAGRGCAELLAHDDAVPAMLLERLGPNLAELGFSVPRILEAITDTLRSFWRPIADDGALRSGAQKARWLESYIADSWNELGRPCDRSIVDRALMLCERRAAAFDPTRAVLVHGDAHGWNTLDAGDGTFKFVDAEGVWSEPEHDLAVAMREYNEPLLAGDTPRLVRARAEHLAERCAVDPDVVWEWGFIERVSTGLSNLRNFDNDNGAMFLEVAKRCL
jgi:streptomycin 6-kinase